MATYLKKTISVVISIFSSFVLFGGLNIGTKEIDKAKKLNAIMSDLFIVTHLKIIITFVCMPRDISALRIASTLSVMLSFYVVLTIVFEACLLRGTSTHIEIISMAIKCLERKSCWRRR